MNSALKWFARTEQETGGAPDDDERDENSLETFELPPHVQEFLALKSAVGV